jgi:NDP-sugar pyrophosphorylase family protein
MMKANPVVTMPLFVLAGGFGTRLSSVLNGSPKALASVNGKPFLFYQIEHWLHQGINSFVFLLHHHADAIINFLKKEEGGLLKDCNIRYVTEPSPLGTGGAIAFAIKVLNFEGDFLLANADTWLGLGFDQIMSASSPAILVVKVKNVGRYGEVVFDHNRLVTSFIEKRINQNAGWINTGVSRINASFFKGWDGQAFSLESVTYPKLVAKQVLSVLTLDTDFIDIGTPEDYTKFCRWVESRKMVGL